MLRLQIQTLKRRKPTTRLDYYRRFFAFFFLTFGLLATAFSFRHPTTAQNSAAQNVQSLPFRVGERLTYSVSFGNFSNAAFAEIFVASRGKVGEKDAVELRSRIKTTDFVSSAFYSLDERRTTFVSPQTILPLYIRKTFNAGVLPREVIYNYLVNPTTTNDLLTFIYQARGAGGVGVFTFQEDEITYSVNLQSTIAERVKTDAGDFETSVSLVQSPYFTERQISDLRVNFSADELRIPVLIRFKTPKGEFRAELASRQTIEPEAAVQPAESPLSTAIPLPQKTPTPRPTPTPYLENQPLSNDLPFALGETLEYQVSMLGKYFGNVSLQVKERKQFAGQDNVLLTATATGTEPGNPLFNLNDAIRSQVNPDTLAPAQIELKSAGFFSRYNQVALFDQKNGFVTIDGANRGAIPVGTHSLLSLAYAVRSFNLKPSKDAGNPVNDTRVAVFVDSQPYVFTLRPANGEIINLKGEKIAAQMITVATGNANIDQLGARVWLSLDEKRLPLRFTIGNYQADLISETNISPK